MFWVAFFWADPSAVYRLPGFFVEAGAVPVVVGVVGAAAVGDNFRMRPSTKLM